MASSSAPSSAPRYSVFISHAGEDKRDMAFPLHRMLKERWVHAFVDEEDMKPGADAPKEMTHAMDAAHIGIFILSPEFLMKEWTIKELRCFQTRQELSNTRIPVIIPLFYRLNVRDCNIDKLLNNDRYRNTLETVRFYERQSRGEPEADVGILRATCGKLVKTMGIRNDECATNEDTEQMRDLRDRLLKRACDAIWDALPQGSSFVPRNPQNLQPDFESRNEANNPLSIEARIKDALLTPGPNTNQVVAVFGMGGVGKTTALRWASHQCDILKKFYDGVYYMPISKHATKPSLIRSICDVVQDLGDKAQAKELEREGDLSVVIKGARECLSKKRFALIIDDVWKLHALGRGMINELLGIATAGENSAVVFTTRERAFAYSNQVSHRVEALPREAEGKESRAILFKCASFDDTETQQDEVEESISGLLKWCGGLPVALSIVGKSVAVLESSFRCGANRAWIQFSSRMDVRRLIYRTEPEDYAYANLRDMQSVALDILEERRLRGERGRRLLSHELSFHGMHHSLCVLKKQDFAPLSMLQHLWLLKGMDALVREVANALAEVSLAEMEIRRVNGNDVEGLRVHDVIHDIATEDAVEAGAVTGLHGRVVDGYGFSLRQVEGCRELWGVSEGGDGYFGDNIARHMVEAGGGKELVTLVTRPEWMRRQLGEGGILQIEGDFAEAIAFADEQDDGADVGSSDCAALKLLAGAVRLGLSSIEGNPSEIGFQLYGRLVDLSPRYPLIQSSLLWVSRKTVGEWIRPLRSCLIAPIGRLNGMIQVGDSLQWMILLNEREVACACGNGYIAVVDFERGEVVRAWRGHDKRICDMAASHGGACFVTASRDGTVKVWDSKTEEQKGSLSLGHRGEATCVALLPDGDTVVSGFSDGRGMVWSAASGQVLCNMSEVGESAHGRRGMECVSVTRDGKTVASKRVEERVRFWSTATGQETWGPVRGSEFIDEMWFTRDGKRLVSCTFMESRVDLWDVVTGRHIRRANCRGVYNVRVSSDDGRILCGSDDGSVRVLDNKTLEPIGDPLRGHVNEVNGVVAVRDGHGIVSCGADGTVRLWVMPERDGRRATEPQYAPGRWHTDEEDPCSPPYREFEVLGMSPDGTRVVSCYLDELFVWNCATGELVGGPLKGHTDKVVSASMTADNQRVVSVSHDKTVRVWEIGGGRQVGMFKDHAARVRYVTLTPAGDRAATGGWDDTVYVWDLDACDGTHVTLAGHEDGIRGVHVTADGARVVSVDGVGCVRVWAIDSGAVVKSFHNMAAEDMTEREVLEEAGESALPAVQRIEKRGRGVVLWRRRRGEAEAVKVATFDEDVRCVLASDVAGCVAVHLGDPMCDTSLMFLRLEAGVEPEEAADAGGDGDAPQKQAGTGGVEGKKGDFWAHRRKRRR